jgi:hypothetical protein
VPLKLVSQVHSVVASMLLILNLDILELRNLLNFRFTAQSEENLVIL